MPVDSKRLLDALKKQVKLLEQDLRAQAERVPALADALAAEWTQGRAAGRTNDAFGTWREAQVTQAAVHWVLGCVFVRFLEDNGLVAEPLLAAPPGPRLQAARDRQQAFFADPAHHTSNDRHWLEHVFVTVAELPAAGALFDRAHNPVWAWPPSADAARGLVAFWRQVDPDTGALAHDFADPAWETRFLGDLYQDLSKEAKKKFALLQTPVFVEEFILDRTLEPALGEFGLDAVRCIDPTCGSGHFLLGAFHRLLGRWQAREPGTPERRLVQRALDGVYGVDLNPFAVAVARFRLLVAALQASDLTRLADAPAYRFHLAVGDSLYHGHRAGQLPLGDGSEAAHPHAFAAEDVREAERILGQRYHAVVGNPPYITVRDKALNRTYRERYASCHRQYALSVPFAERFFELAIEGDRDRPAGYVGMITSNSFMRREFGTKLIQEYFPHVDLTHVLDAVDAHIPGHGTPTVLLFGRNRAPVGGSVRAVMGIRGEARKPTDPARGKVWRAIVEQVDQVGSESTFVSVADVPRERLSIHPWSMGGGGASELRELVERAGVQKVQDVVEDIGFGVVTREDELYSMPRQTALRLDVSPSHVRTLVDGECVREWGLQEPRAALWPYDPSSLGAQGDQATLRILWPYRAQLSDRVAFGKSQVERGLEWFEYSMFFRTRFSVSRTIAYGEVATHNHFVLDRDGLLFDRTAPVIKLAPDADETAHVTLLGALNSSVACFWLRQVCQPKGGSGIGRGVQNEPWEQRYGFNGSNVEELPLCDERPTDLATTLDTLARERQALLPDALVARGALTRDALAAARDAAAGCLARMIALQEELDWRCYRLYGITEDELTYRDAAGAPKAPPPLALGQRAFEIVLARQVESGEEDETTWFARHGSTSITELPAAWPDDYRALVERRIALIEEDRYTRLLERPEYKRRWKLDAWDKLQARALRAWLLDRLESPAYWPEPPRLQTVRALADRAAGDAEFRAVGELFTGDEAFDAAALVRDLVGEGSVPFLPVLRYRDSGLRKRQEWEATWAAQRTEDAIDAAVLAGLPRVADESAAAHAARLAAEGRRRREAAGVTSIPRPPRYDKADFVSADAWGLRGPLDVPRERFIAYPHCQREGDASLVVGWAGWTTLQQAEALGAWYHDLVEREGWPAERLMPVFAGLVELVPWLRQWHNAVDRKSVV